MGALRPHPVLVLLSMVLAGTVSGCGDEGTEAFRRGQPADLSGPWKVDSAVTFDDCELSSTVRPIGYSGCGISQSGETLTISCSEVCGDSCSRGTGTVHGDDVSFALYQWIVLSPECSLEIDESDTGIVSGESMIGESTLIVSAAGNCPGTFPCTMRGLFNFERYPPGTIFLECISTCP